MTCSLYRLTFPNGKIYLGITSLGVHNRFRGHCNGAFKAGTQTRLSRALRKYGADSVVIDTLAVGELSYIRDMEVKAIAYFGSQHTDIGYNICAGGQSSPMTVPEVAARSAASRLNPSEETRRKLSVAASRRKHTPSSKEKMRIAKLESWRIRRENGTDFLSDEHKKNISAAHKGKTLSVETRAKLSVVVRGKRPSEETRAKLRLAQRARRQREACQLVVRDRGR